MKKIILGLGIVGSLMITGCTYKTATVKYDTYNAYTSDVGGNIKYKEIAPISVTTNGFVWDSCADLTSRALKSLQDKAKALGGNGVMKVRWATDNGWSVTPTCSCGCGWFALYVVGGLGPWVQTAHAEGVAIKLKKNGKIDNK